MSSNEEYLDNLLKSMDGDSGSQRADGAEEMDDEDIDALFAAAERILNGELSEDEPADAGFYGRENAVEASTAEPEAEEAGQEPLEEPADVEEAQEAPTVESAKDMSQEEIEALLASTENQLHEETEEAVSEHEGDAAEQDDLMALLGGPNSNEDLNAIGDLLEAADSGELPADAENTDAKDSAAEEPEAFFPDITFPEGMEEEPAENTEDDGKKGKKKRAPKPKKEKKVKEKKEKKKKGKGAEAEGNATAEGEAATADGMAEQPEKKKGFFSKLLTALTEEEESNISDENQAIMQELEEEDLKEAGKKKKMKKGKKPAGGKGESDEDEENTGKDKKKGKPKKEPKPKKQKEPKEPKEPAVPEKPGKRISPKSIVVVVLFAATVFGGIFLSISLFSGELRMQSAIDAFEQGDYMTCYEEMYGMDLDAEEEMMFRHAEIVLKMQRRITIYEKYIGEGRELEALDSLMQAVADYDDMYTKAQECGAGLEVAGLYDRIIQILQDNYGVNQDAARAIALCSSNVDYTRYLTALVTGESISTGGNQGGISLPEEELQDVLPAEEELNQPGFAD